MEWLNSLSKAIEYIENHLTKRPGLRAVQPITFSGFSLMSPVYRWQNISAGAE